jgi:8-oxo-dGTP diphosphatase
MGTKHTSGAIALDLVAIGIVRRNDHLVMVRPVSEDGRRSWYIPGGLIEGGELADEGLKRELREETGVEVIGISRLAFMSHIDRPEQRMQTIVFGFDIPEWRGDLGIDDSDGEIEEVALVPFAEACQRLRDNGGWPGVQEPLLAYLEEKAAPGTLWFYREERTGQQRTSSPHDPGRHRIV